MTDRQKDNVTCTVSGAGCLIAWIAVGLVIFALIHLIVG